MPGRRADQRAPQDHGADDAGDRHDRLRHGRRRGTFGATATNQILTPLRAAGYRLVQRAWQAPNGWLTGPGGPLALGCRYATLVQAIHDRIAPSGPTCVTGNSGGSGEIAYALAHYGMGRLIDLAVPSSGPPFGRIDYGCAPAVLSYPQTEVRFIYGAADGSSAVPLGRLYANAVRSAKTITAVPGVGHQVPATAAGASQIYADLRNGCFLRH